MTETLCIESIDELSALTSRIIVLHDEGAQRYYTSRWSRDWMSWMKFVNEKATILPDKLYIRGEAEDLLRIYSRALDEYDDTHEFVGPVFGALLGIIRFDALQTFHNFVKIRNFLVGEQDLKKSTDLFRICYALERQYLVTNIDISKSGIMAKRSLYVREVRTYHNYMGFEGGIAL